MYCRKCGTELTEDTRVCPQCGQPVGAPVTDTATGEYEGHPNGWLKAACLLFPIVGLIMYLVYVDSAPVKAKDCGKFAIIGVSIKLGLVFVVFLLLVIFVALGILLFN
jgi:hypothetical protein